MAQGHRQGWPSCSGCLAGVREGLQPPPAQTQALVAGLSAAREALRSSPASPRSSPTYPCDLLPAGAPQLLWLRWSPRIVAWPPGSGACGPLGCPATPARKCCPRAIHLRQLREKQMERPEKIQAVDVVPETCETLPRGARVFRFRLWSAVWEWGPQQALKGRMAAPGESYESES